MSTLELENIKHPDNSGDNIALASNGSITIDRQSTDGTIAEFRKDGTAVGKIGNSGNALYIEGTSNAGAMFYPNAMLPVGGTSGTLANNTVDLGRAVNSYKDLYLGGGVYLGGTGAANKLDDYEEGTFTPGILNGWGILNPTYSTNAGFYTKVGNIVHVAFRITLSGGSTNANGLRLVGLPFTVGATTNVGTNLSGWFSTASGNVENVFLGLEANDVHPLFYYKNATGTSTFLGTDAGTGFSMTFSGTYQTA